MAGEKVAMNAQSGRKSNGDEGQKRERSTIEFPYGDLDDALKVVNAIHTNAGLSATTDQLAAYMKQSSTSGAFRLRCATAAVFGLTANERGTVSLTALGRKLVDPSQARQAKAEAFLMVPLYRAIFEKFKGHMLPPAAALEREMANLGVSTKQTDKARQAFDRSAEQAGFFAHGSDRLVMPAGVEKRDLPKPTDTPPQAPPLRTGNGGGGDLPPFIQGLLGKIPTEGDVWPLAERVKWLQTASNIFDLMYKAEDGAETVFINIELAKI